ITMDILNILPNDTIQVINAPADGCNGGTAAISCNAVPNATTYTWTEFPLGCLTFNGQPGPYVTNSPSVNVTFGTLPLGAAGYNVCVKASNSCDSTANTKCIWIRGGVSVPTYHPSNPPTPCANSTLTYYILPDTGASSFTWSITGNATIISGQGSDHVSINFLSNWTTGTLCVYGS